MNIHRVASIGSTVLIVLAVGLAASTLGTSMSTDPADAVDVDVGALPLDDDSAGALQVQIQKVHDQYTGESTSDTSPQSDAERAESAGGASNAGGGSSAVSDAPAQGAGPGQNRGDSVLDELLSVLLALLGLFVAGSATYRYRERLRRILTTAAPLGTEPAIPAPENAVEEAWVELVNSADVPRPLVRTPRDCARIAVENGYDADEVYRLCRTFEAVSYGGAPPTDEQERIARETLDRLDRDRQ